MIYAVNMTCDRDWDLKDLMTKTLLKHSPSGTRIVSHNTDCLSGDYTNGSGWQASMMKVDAIKQLLNENNIQDTDFILSVDSDVVFTNPEVFKYVNPEYGIIGIKHRPEYYTMHGSWSHMSGALIFIRGDIAKKIVALTENELTNIRFNHFKPYSLTENEDVVLSYLSKCVGATWFDLGTVPGLSSGDFESDVEVSYLSKGVNIYCWYTNTGKDALITARPNQMRSFYHLNYCPTQFLGEPITGKWQIPSVLKKKGIEL